jgi:hypothetical protein
MARLFEVTVECDCERPAAEKTLAALSGSLSVLGGERGTSAGFIQDYGGALWVVVTTDLVGRSGIGDKTTAQLAVGTAQAWIRILRRCSGYRYARIGLDVEMFATREELLRDRAHWTQKDGLIVNDELWAALGKPEWFVPFAAGFRWYPYRGAEFPTEEGFELVPFEMLDN